MQAYLYDTDDILLLHSHAEKLPWFMVLIIPIIGGLIVGVILNRFTNDGRVRSVADVIEGSAITDGRVEVKAGIASFFASLITLSSGGVNGGARARWCIWPGSSPHGSATEFTRMGSRAVTCWAAPLLRPCRPAFNAPIAGALFALEVVLRHFAVHAFAPIVIASVAGTVINRLEYGDVTEFTLETPGSLQFYVELPAFLNPGPDLRICRVAADAVDLLCRGYRQPYPEPSVNSELAAPCGVRGDAGADGNLVSAYHRRWV